MEQGTRSGADVIARCERCRAYVTRLKLLEYLPNVGWVCLDLDRCLTRCRIEINISRVVREEKKSVLMYRK